MSGLTLDVGEYRRLPPAVREAFDAWLDVEDLRHRRIVELTLGEGFVTARCWSTGEDGRVLIQRGGPAPGPVSHVEVIPVRTVPPAEAFAGRTE